MAKQLAFVILGVTALAGCTSDHHGPYVLKSSQSVFVIPEQYRVERPERYPGGVIRGDDASRSLLVRLPTEGSSSTKSSKGRAIWGSSVIGVLTAAEEMELRRQVSARMQELSRINSGAEEFAGSRAEPDSQTGMWRIYRNDSGNKQWVQLRKQPPLDDFADLLGHCMKTELGPSPRCLVTLMGKDYLFTTHVTVPDLEALGELDLLVSAAADHWRTQ